MQYRAGGRFKNTRGVITNVVETICHLDWNCVTLKCRITEQCQISTQCGNFYKINDYTGPNAHTVWIF